MMRWVRAAHSIPMHVVQMHKGSLLESISVEVKLDNETATIQAIHRLGMPDCQGDARSALPVLLLLLRR